MSLKLKTIFGIAIIEAILLGLLISMTSYYLKSTNYQELIKRATTIATLFATTTKDAVLSYDLASLETLTAELMKNPDLVYVKIIAPSGKVFSQAGDQQRLKQPFIEDHDVEQVSDDVFDISAKITEGGELFGTIQLGIETTFMNQQIRTGWRWSLLIAIGEMVLVALFSFILGSYLVGRLSQLRAAAYRISKGEMNVSVTTSGADEISEVARAFNEMSSRLKLAAEIRKKNEQELESLNHTLESRVERRTEALKRTHDQLIHSEKMASIGTLVAGVAHEINNPIGFVMSNIRMLAQYMPIYTEVIERLKAIDLLQTDQEVREALSELNHWLKQKNIMIIQEDMDEIISDTTQGIERIGTIVTGLKEFSHVDQDKSHKLTNLNEAIERTLQVTKNELKYKAKTNVDLTHIPLVNCNVEQIQQVLLNLIINASHAIKNNGLIHIRSWAENDQVLISVADNGSGIDPSMQKKIFDPFFTTKPIGQGTGLGLAIAYGIMDEHQGQIKVESELGKGTCFTLSFPVEKESL